MLCPPMMEPDTPVLGVGLRRLNITFDRHISLDPADLYVVPPDMRALHDQSPGLPRFLVELTTRQPKCHTRAQKRDHHNSSPCPEIGLPLGGEIDRYAESRRRQRHDERRCHRPATGSARHESLRPTFDLGWSPNAMGFGHLGVDVRFPVLVTVGSSWGRAC